MRMDKVEYDTLLDHMDKQQRKMLYEGLYVLLRLLIVGTGFTLGMSIL